MLGIVCYAPAPCQQYTQSTFNLTLVPGLGTSGLDPSNNYSNITLNLLSGYQRGNFWFEISGLSSTTIEQTNGIQLSGLFNLVGVDYYQGLSPKELIKAEKEGYFPFLNGIQIAGLMNYVRGYSTGAQLSLGMNISKEAMTGAQIGGIFNYSKILLTGAQISILSNLSKGSTIGFQMAIYNRTSFELSGIQIGVANLSGSIEGKNSLMETESTGIQLGLINHSKIMNGFQVGLVNLSGQNQGTQFGLINIFRPARKKGRLDGTPIGLLNIGGALSLEAFIDETFLMNFALSTGNMKNAGMLPENKIKYIMNQLLFRQSRFSKSEYRAYGWGLQKQYFNYSPDIMNAFYFVSFGWTLSYVDFINIDNNFNVLTELGYSIGSRIIPKNRSVYLYATLDINYFYSNDGQTLGPEKLMIAFNSGDAPIRHELWPGISIGIKIN